MADITDRDAGIADRCAHRLAYPGTPSPTATTTPAPQIDVDAQAKLVEYQGQIEALICEFQLIGTQGFSGKKLLEGRLAYSLELNIRDEADVINRLRGLRFGDETADEQVSNGTGEPDRLLIYQSVQGEGPFGCELEGATVEGEPVRLGGTTSVTGE